MNPTVKTAVMAIPDEALPALVLLGLLRIAAATEDETNLPAAHGAFVTLLEDALRRDASEDQALAVGVLLGLITGGATHLMTNTGSNPLEIYRGVLAKKAAAARLRN